MVAEAEAARAAALQVGDIIAGRYRVESQLGRGSTGVVHRVLDERTGNRLALKRLRIPEGATPAPLVTQFEREYHTLCQLAHPRIIEVYDYGRDGDDAFYTMELLDGQDLRERGRLPWRQACAILRDVASSLAILHSRRLLHRDLSARNVRCTSDGRAKLIDFGAMAQMGGVKQVIGTPPFVPPEALQLQALDARADLYALGALAYYVLTGRYAYSARTFADLPDAWRSPPAPLGELAPDAPRALDQLVTQLLQLDRTARPGTAAEVMERLSGIAGLPLQERAEVGRAYLATPTLVGREALLKDVRAALVSSLRGQGACVLIEGVAGTGRSRMLDACVLEAKLLGATVLRADAADAAAEEYGVAKVLCAQLFQAAPELAQRNARPFQQQLAHLIEPLAVMPAPGAPERSRLQAALRDFLLAVARGKRIVIAVDDAEAIDEASSALLALLAHGAQRRNLSLLLVAEQHAQSPALALLREASRTLVLQPLAPAETEALLRSVFGDVDHLAMLAGRVHDLSLGNPRWVMALAERLVERGVARYEAGSFRLPEVLAPGDLPASLSAALAARVSGLPDAARELAQALAFTEPLALSLERYPLLTGDGDHGLTYRALDALLASGVLVASGDRFRFAQRELVSLLRGGVSEASQRSLHARIARAVQGCEDPALLPHHLLLSGAERAAIECLLPLRADPAMAYSRLALELLERASIAAERLGLPTEVRIELLMWMLDNAAMLGAYRRFLQHALPLLDQLELESGLRDCHAQDPALPAQARLAQGLARAQQRHDATPVAQRGLSPTEAIPRLARLCAMFNTMTAVVQDLSLSERVPSLEPLTLLSPALDVVEQMVQATRAFQAGRYDESGEISLAVLERVSQPDRAGLDPAYHKAVRLGVMYVQGALAAARGQAAVSAWVAELEQDPGHRVNAVRLRMAHELMQGNIEAARECQRRAELLQLQDRGQQLFPGGTHRIELLAYTNTQDVVGVKRAMERIESSAARYPCWQVTADVARAVYRRLQGDDEGALAALAPVFSAASPGRHVDWGFAAAVHVSALIGLARFDDAVARGREYLDICLRERLSPTHRSLMRVLSDALLGAGRLDEAAALADACVREHESVGARGLMLGMACETRARIAIAQSDRAAFTLSAERCAREYQRGHGASLRARYASLMREAEARGLAGAAQVRKAEVWAEADSRPRQVPSRLLTAASAEERACTGLELLLEATGASRGFLFGLQGGALALLAASEPGLAPPALGETLDAYFRSQLAAEAAVTAVESAQAKGTPLDCWSDGAGRAFEPLLLFGIRDGERCIAGLAALHYAGDERPPPRRALLEAVAEALLEYDDVDPVTCAAVP